MIKTFKQFNEAITSDDMKNAINLNMEKQDKQKVDPNAQQQKPQDLQKNANVSVTNLQKYIDDLNIQKQRISDEIGQLENAQRDLMPNNPSDPNNAKNQKLFVDGQQAKIKNNQNLLNALEEKIKLLQAQIINNKEKYL